MNKSIVIDRLSRSIQGSMIDQQRREFERRRRRRRRWWHISAPVSNQSMPSAIIIADCNSCNLHFFANEYEFNIFILLHNKLQNKIHTKKRYANSCPYVELWCNQSSHEPSLARDKRKNEKRHNRPEGVCWTYHAAADVMACKVNASRVHIINTPE